jgi:hypothetical protein
MVERVPRTTVDRAGHFFLYCMITYQLDELVHKFDFTDTFTIFYMNEYRILMCKKNAESTY